MKKNEVKKIKTKKIADYLLFNGIIDANTALAISNKIKNIEN